MADRSARDTVAGGLWILRPALESLFEQAGRAAPEECCGVLLGRGSVIERAMPAANMAEDRHRRFEIDPQALVDAHRAARSGGPQVMGYFHSHPDGRAEPSATDAAMANRDGSVWTIVCGSDVTFWRDGEDGFIRLSYAIKDR